MRNTLAILAFVSSFAIAPSVNAIAITGQLVMDGTVNLDTQALADATKVVSFGNDVYANAASTGVFEEAGLLGEAVSVNGFDFTDFSAVSPLWTLLTGTDTFKFSLTGLTVVDHASTFLDILGTGTLTSDNPHYDSTAGTFSFSISDADGQGSGATFKFGFTASTTGSTSVPDGGASAGMLGLGVLALVALKRRF